MFDVIAYTGTQEWVVESWYERGTAEARARELERKEQGPVGYTYRSRNLGPPPPIQWNPEREGRS